MLRLDLLTVAEQSDWLEVLERSGQYDFYHLPQYHALAQERGEGSARLFLYTEGAYAIALPLLLRPLDQFSFPEAAGTEWQDATSVYGYAGPLCSHGEVPDAVACNFRCALEERLRYLRVVAVFSRLHPLLRQQTVLAGLGECQAVSRTVSIDLTLPREIQCSQVRKRFRGWINRLGRDGVTCVHDRVGAHLPDFVRIYYETMRRVQAANGYYLPPKYFERLWKSLESRIHLFLCLKDGQAVCAGLFVACQGILQYHLGGTLSDALKLSPMKLMMDRVRRWASDQGFRVLHLGGGTTARPDDPLLHFKKGFSDRTHEFSVWRWVLFPDMYQKLGETKSAWNERHGVRAAIAGYFPEYRCPTLPCGRGEYSEVMA